MDKQHILDEIKRITEFNNGKPLGMQRFSTETGIQSTDWFGKYWARWGDAIKEAGYESNTMQGAYEDDFVVGKLVSLI